MDYKRVTGAEAREMLARRHSFGIHNIINRALSTIMQQEEEIAGLQLTLTRLRADAAALYDEARFARDCLAAAGTRYAGDLPAAPDNPYRPKE